MKRLRYCRRCGNVFETQAKFGRICDKCRLNSGGWYQASQKNPYNIDNLLNTRKWRFGQYDKEK